MKTRKVSVSHTYPKWEIELISEDQVRFGLCFPLMDKLNDTGAIRYEEKILRNGNVKRTAIIEFVKP